MLVFRFQSDLGESGEIDAKFLCLSLNREPFDLKAFIEAELSWMQGSIRFDAIELIEIKKWPA